MFTHRGTPAACAASTPARSGELHSIKTTASNVSPAGISLTTRSLPGRNRYITGTPSELPTVARCPRPHNARASARVDPKQSPSGDTWLRSRTLRRLCRASAIRSAGSIPRSLAFALRHLAQQTLHAGPALDRLVQSKQHLRDVAKPDPPPQFLPDEALGVAETRHRLGLRLRVAKDAHKHLGMAHVLAQFDIRDGHEPDAGILHLPLENGADFHFELLTKPGNAHAHEASPHLHREIEHHEIGLPPDGIRDVRQDLIGVADVRADVRHGETGAAPGILVRDLGGRHMEAVVQAGQQRLHDPPFVLDALRSGKATLHPQHPDHHRPVSRARANLCMLLSVHRFGAPAGGMRLRPAWP